MLVTGAGGGVALICIQLCIAKGANVFVTSGSEEKIQRAVSVGAKGGVNYKQSRLSTDSYMSGVVSFDPQRIGQHSLVIC